MTTDEKPSDEKPSDEKPTEEKPTEEKPTEETPPKKARASADDYKQIAREVVNEGISARYVECPTCGDMITRKNGKCIRCGLEYNTKTKAWQKIAPQSADDKDSVSLGNSIFRISRRG